MQNNNVIAHKTTTMRIVDLRNQYENGHLNLNPGFQRQSVWNERDRAKLIDSILRNYPLPAIFLYKREENGKLVFDVIDGKQRLESMFMFMGNMRGRFQVSTHLPDASSAEYVGWNTLKRRKLQYLLEGYEIPVIEVDGDIGDIISVFVRINSTGKALTPQEKRHARYYRSELLKEASRMARRFEDYFRDHDIFSHGQLCRMKHIEFMCELMLSLVTGDVLNKKTALDRVMETPSMGRKDVMKASRMSVSALRHIKHMFPKLKTTRMRQVSDFYSLAVLIGKFEQEKLVLTDRKRNRLAWDILQAFSVQVDEVRELQRKAKGARTDQEIYRDYLLTVSQMTDDISQRRKREQILRNLLQSLFARKDSQRGFTAEQRRILWNTASDRKCSYPGCCKKLTWDDFTVDHISPYSKGGQTQLKNAALMCRAHNSSKGNRRVA
ncbi:MAG: DUF262 domain-containing protein [Elusimicrobiales bacterium]